MAGTRDGGRMGMKLDPRQGGDWTIWKYECSEGVTEIMKNF